MASAEQDQWQEICAAVRAGLAQQVPLMPAMTQEEISYLVTAIDDAMWNEVKAAAYDEAVEERRATLERESKFGGA